MRTISLLILISVSIAFASSNAFAGAGGNAPPDGVCGILKEDGVTKGLFGLCVAYCEAGAASEKVLDNYNRKKSATDPDMPCLETQDPFLNCACWNTSTPGQVGLGADAASSCSFDENGETLFYYEDTSGDLEILSVTEGACSRLYTSETGEYLFSSESLVNEQEQMDCDDELLAIAQVDFAGFPCLGE